MFCEESSVSNEKFQSETPHGIIHSTNISHILERSIVNRLVTLVAKWRFHWHVTHPPIMSRKDGSQIAASALSSEISASSTLCRNYSRMHIVCMDMMRNIVGSCALCVR